MATLTETLEAIDQAVNTIVGCRDDMLTLRRIEPILTAQQHNGFLNNVNTRYTNAVTFLSSIDLPATTKDP